MRRWRKRSEKAPIPEAMRAAHSSSVRRRLISPSIPSIICCSANAHLWQGLTRCNSFFDNPEAARESYDLARASCGANQPDHNMWQDLQTLGAKILRKASVHPALKAWSQGAVGEKTFRQISEEFAEIVIAQVWEREGRKVSRVAARLSISPKKVRRILARVGRRKPRQR